MSRLAFKNAETDRERLILEHLPQVRLIALRIRERLPRIVNLEDLISAGMLGLIAAVDRFDPARNVKLKTYAEHKIRGAILDSLRDLDWVPRQQRCRSKRIAAAISSTEQRLGRPPTEEEIAGELNLSLEEYRRWLLDLWAVKLGSPETLFFDAGGRNLLKNVASSSEPWPSDLLEKSELHRLLDQAIEQMPVKEGMVIRLHYGEQLPLREIAQIMRCHPSRVSQIKSAAILRLRSHLEKRWPLERGSPLRPRQELPTAG